MIQAGFYISKIQYSGPTVEPVSISFGQGLNVVYGASNTGKSFLVETIDFMLGGKGPLPDIPEINDFDEIEIVLAAYDDSEEVMLRRSVAGGSFSLLTTHDSANETHPEAESETLSETHNAKREDNLSKFLLKKLGLDEKVVRKNARNDVVSLSFRHIARLFIVNEEEIIQKRSPLSDGNYTADTTNTSVFKFMLTGVDDSSLTSTKAKTSEEFAREAQIDLLDQLISQQEQKISQLSGSKTDIQEQESRLRSAISSRQELLNSTEAQFKEISDRRRTILKRLETQRERYLEIVGLLERFRLLRRHYSSDMERLLGIKEAGSVFNVLDGDFCPVCGAESAFHRSEHVCVDDVEKVVSAATAELAKIESKEDELSETIKALEAELGRLEKLIPRSENELHRISKEIETVISPDLRKMRAGYQELSDKMVSVREAASLFDNLEDLKVRKSVLEQSNTQGEPGAAAENSRLTNTAVDPFAKLVQDILTDWGFPGGDRVHFDLDKKDLVISGKPRTSFGKGLRAVTQSAFTIALREYCLKLGRGHPGIVVLDSPLLSYKEPDGPEDDLSQTNLNEKFYDYLGGLTSSSQTIIIENTDPPNGYKSDRRFQHFNGRGGVGRFGLLPVREEI